MENSKIDESSQDKKIENPIDKIEQDLIDDKGLGFFEKIIIFFCLAFILFAFLAPSLLVKHSTDYDFTNTGEIGDTIGGLMNPFIAIGSCLLTFLAFYIQFKANQQSIKLFKASIKEERNKESRIQNAKEISLIELIKTDLDLLKKDLESRIEDLNDYIEEQDKNPYSTVNLTTRPLTIYKALNRLDRPSVFNSFFNQYKNKDNWEKCFGNLFNLSSYFEESFTTLYDKSSNHSNSVYKLKLEIRDNLVKWLHLSAQIKDSLKNYKPDTFQAKIFSIIKNGQIKYEDLVDETSINESEFDYFTLLNYFKNDYIKSIVTVLETSAPIEIKELRNLLEYVHIINLAIEQIKFDNLIFKKYTIEKCKIELIEYQENSVKRKLDEVITFFN